MLSYSKIPEIYMCFFFMLVSKCYTFAEPVVMVNAKVRLYFQISAFIPPMYYISGIFE